MKYTVLDYAEDVLKTAKTPMVFQEIWEAGKNSDFAKKLNLTGKTPWNSLGARLFVDVRDNPDSRFVRVGKNPTRFFLKSRQRELPSNIAELMASQENRTDAEYSRKHHYSERDLHPLLSYFAYTNAEFNHGRAIYTKTIFHENSKKDGYNQWLHPDLVGFYIPIEDWHPSLLSFSGISSDANAVRIYSFELKKKIDRSNYRECFFQTVSNSSWAHEGYLAAAVINDDDDLYAELERLSTAFGIGVIRLDLEDIDASRVLFPAQSKKRLDWEMMNKLCEQNRDFARFIDDVRKDYEVKTIHKSEYDEILEDIDEYIGKIMRKT
jgi:hypothetical protein